MKFILTAGGTGGHIYPALAVLDEIKKDKNNEYLFIGTKNRMENDLIPSLGIPYESLEIYGLSKTNIVRNIKNLSCISSAYKKCLKIMDEYKPDAVIAFGGYVTLPVCLAAKKRGVKVFLHEQNMLPGKTNIYLSKKVDAIFVSFKDGTRKLKSKNIIFSGNPVAQRAIETKKYSKTDLGFNKDKKLIIIVMGSLGSTSVNEKILNFLRNYDEEDTEILFITGKSSYADLNNNLIVPKSTKIVPFFDNLPSLMKSCDLIISRAGASTIAEIMATRTPSILIPSPYVANNHQYYNALDLVNKKVSILIEEKDLDEKTLINAINEMFDESTMEETKKNLSEIKDISSSTIIVDEIKKILKENNEKKGS
ncbi:MAG: undecaprenyldiphospho-muramoylpentapeptide beta-N-acetylglucosaminyltransferase [Tenericutes bacterium]|nr:undecaprenyldiphospho-muramoylpentapeptide beta-N-acetylglucosaminyltransferase [Mycoplasmatota bacterium]